MTPNLPRIRRLLEAPVPTRPQWAPGGARLVYTVARADTEANRTASELWMLDAQRLRAHKLCGGLPGADPQVTWAPDGARLAYLESDAETKRVVVVGVDGPRRQIDLADAPHGSVAAHPFYRTCAWSPAGDRLLYAAHDPSPDEPPDPVVDPRNDGDELGEVERIRLWVLDLDGASPPRPVTSAAWHSGAGVWTPDGRAVVFVSNRSGREESAVSNLTQPFALWRAELADGAERLLTAGPGALVAPACAADGQRIAFLAAPRLGGPHAHNMELTAADAAGGGRRSLTAGLDRSVDPQTRPVEAPGGAWVAAVQDGMRNTLVRARPDRPPQLLAHALPHASLPDVDLASGAIACVTQSAAAPPEIELLAPDGRSRWRSAHHGVESAAQARIWTLRRGDGTAIESLALEPANQPPRGVILWPHGGPHSRTAQEYRPETEAAVRHGFAVVQPNFRGSSGYGRDFLLADHLDLGGADYADCLAALDAWLQDTGRRQMPQYVTGVSYGGYLTAWAVGHTRRFAAAAAVNAVVNVESFFAQTDIPSWVVWEFGGSPLERRALVRQRSPVQHLASAVTPTLVLHSAADRRVPLAQGLELHAALRAAGAPTMFVRYPREPHRIAEPAHRADVIARTLAWFFDHAPP